MESCKITLELLKAYAESKGMLLVNRDLSIEELQSFAAKLGMRVLPLQAAAAAADDEENDKICFNVPTEMTTNWLVANGITFKIVFIFILLITLLYLICFPVHQTSRKKNIK